MFPNFFGPSDTLDREKIDIYMKERGFTLLGEGRSRRTYLSSNKRYVLKFHIDKWTTANLNEARIWRKFFSKTNPDNGDCLYAPCRLIGDGHILMMRAMVELYGGTGGCSEARNAGLGGYDTYYDPSTRPAETIKWSTDVCQYGKMANGKYAIYDYG